ncbi:MAG: phospholipase D-like domain-containing protein, partial [Sutterella sp.]
LEEMAKRVFVGEMAGAVGTLASQPEHGLATQKRMFEILGLGVPVFIDTEHKTAHNKVTVTDGRWVATGSYNYNKNAESRNAENLLILDSPELAARYEENWRRHRAHSSAYTEKHAAGAASPKQQ